MKKWIRRLIQIELVLVYLVILAGSVVRMTGSGMGCPDWPKCFGHLIPPTERSEIEWHPNENYKEGQIIIHNESLQVAQSDFRSGQFFNAVNWRTYTKHDYATFNPAHTWTEYINRLFGALSGIPMFLLVVVSLFYIRKNWLYFPLALMGLFMLGFEAWLGKLVVDGNLIPGSITIHMMGALVIIAFLCVMLGIASRENFAKISFTNVFKNLLILSLILTLVQTVIGTQIREQVDHLNDMGVMREDWIENLDWEFYFHRTFSLLILFLNLWLWNFNRRHKLGFKELNPILILIGLEILLGIVLNYVAVPKLAQPAHLLLATFLFGFQFYALVRYALAPKTQIIPVQ